MKKEFIKSKGSFSIIFVLVLFFNFLIFSPTVLAAVSGTANGTYTFGGVMGGNDTGRPGFSTFSDKFYVSNGFEVAGTQLWSANQQGASTTGILVIQAEGVAVCQTFTFKDLGISSYEASGYDLSLLTVELKDAGGARIGSVITNSGTVTLTSTAALLSSLLNSSSLYTYNNVASITIQWKFVGTFAPSNINFDSINVSDVAGAADTAAPTASVSTATIPNTTNVTTAESTEAGTLYLVLDSANITTVSAANAAVTGGTAKKTTGVAASSPTTISTAGLANGAYKVISVDAAGNVSAESTNTVTIDSTAPTASVTTALIPNTTDVTTAESTEAGTLYLVLDSANITTVSAANAAVTGGTAHKTTGVTTSTPTTISTAALADGVYKVIAVDAAGNMSAESTNTITIDMTPPTASVTTASLPNTTNVTTAESTEAGTLYLVLDSANITTVSAADAAVTGGTAKKTTSVTASTPTTISTAALANGAYKVIAVDAIGNVSAESANTVTIDSTAPTASVTTASLPNTTNVTSAESTEAGTLYLVLDSANITTVSAANAAVTGGTAKKTTGVTASTPTTISTAGLANGAYKVIAVDAIGNVSAESTNTITIDTTAPVISLTGNATVNVANGGVYTDAGVTITDNVDTGLTATITYSKGGSTILSINTSVAGTYSIHYNVSDAAGNVAIEVTRTVMVAAVVTSIIPSPTETPTPVKQIITVNVEDTGVNVGQIVSTAVIIRTSQADGTMHDEVDFTVEQAKKMVDSINAAGSTMARIVVPDMKDEVSELNVTVSKKVHELITDASIDLAIATENVTVIIPSKSLDGFTDNLFFRLIPIKDESAKQKVKERANNEAIVKIVAGDQEVSVVGRPITIETNMQNREVKLIIPLKDVKLSEEKMNNLGVYIEHSDGTKELLKGVIVPYNNKGEMGLQFTVSKFSIFSLVQLPVTDEHTSYMKGYKDGTFRPGLSITRAEMAAILSRVITGDAKLADKTYSDVSLMYWAKESISKVTNMGLMKGYANGTFAPEKSITRAEMATILFILIGDKEQAGVSFTDISGHWAQVSILKAQGAGLINGYGDGSFKPDNSLSRAEAVTIINKLLGRGPLSGAKALWTDVPEQYWAYGNIQEASVDHAYEQKSNTGEQWVPSFK